ncbi:MAG: hypothetical protein ABI359_16260 [Ginsengibacter sp.]
MLQNRVDPFGNLKKTTARGHWMGNRGVLHNDQQQIIRFFKLKAWITCKLEFNGRKRQVMAPNRYTELFFLDEATSFAAGHRPCFECRRADYQKFKSLWLKGNPEYGFNEKTPVKKIDDILHLERIDRNKTDLVFEQKNDSIPNGSFVLYEKNPYLVFNEQIYLWSPFGYSKPVCIPAISKLTMLTPKSLINTFRAGYEPQIAFP